MSQRKSSYELLKIIAVFLIILSHLLPNYREIGGSYINTCRANLSFQHVVLILFNYCGNVGNSIFIVCSASFLIDNDNIKISKIINILLNTLIVSVIFFCVYAACGTKFTNYEIVLSFLPFFGRPYWFVTCYAFYYAIHPVLNLVINNLSYKNFSLLTIATALIAFLYKSDITTFILYYFLTALFKRHFTKFCNSTFKNAITLIVSVCILVSSVLLLIFLGLKFEQLSYSADLFKGMLNPCNFFIALTAFNLFGKLNLKSRAINFISSLSLLIYVIHNNVLFRYETVAYAYSFIYHKFTYSRIALWCLTCATVTFILSTGVAALYKITIDKLTSKLSLKLENKITKIKRRS